MNDVVEVVRDFEVLAEEDIARREHELLGVVGMEPERALLYALRVSRCVPACTILSTIASRWRVANSGAGGSGLLAGADSPHVDLVREKLERLYLEAFSARARALVATAKEKDLRAGRSNAANADKATETIQAAWDELTPELPLVREIAESCIADLRLFQAEFESPSRGSQASRPEVLESNVDTAVRDAEPEAGLRLEVEHAKTICFAMEQSGVPIIVAVRIENRSGATMEGLALGVSIEPDLAPFQRFRVPNLRPSEVVHLSPLDLRLAPGRLRTVTEAERGVLRCVVSAGEKTVATHEASLDILAFNEWPGARAPSALLAAFVMPNDPVVAKLLQIARDRLISATGDSAISGYQTQSQSRALAQVRALYEAIQSLGLSYVGLPASFEGVGQKIRLPELLIEAGMGNCIDITVLVAACLEQMGLAPLLVLTEGHAFPAVWLIDERFPEGTVYDVERLRTQVDLRQILPFDSSTMIASGAPSIDAATAVATRHLAAAAGFAYAIDVRTARTARFRPLALRVDADHGGAAVDVGATAPRGADGANGPFERAWAQDHRRPATSDTAGKSAPADGRFKKWKERLLDLTLRNRLVSFRPDGKSSIPLRVPDAGRFEDLLSLEQVFEVIPAPANQEGDHRSFQIVEARLSPEEEQARLVADQEARRIHSELTEKELVPRAKEMARRAREDLEESGATTLFAAIGLLKWYESDSSELPRFAPLLLIPIALRYESGRGRVLLTKADEDPIGNVTLAEKMRADFALDFGALIDVEPDDTGVNLVLLLRRIREAIQSRPRWEVVPTVQVGQFSFSKFLMWQDLERNSDVLLQSPVVRHIVMGGSEAFPDPVGEVGPGQVDSTIPALKFPTVVDGDSSQLAAVWAALSGRSFVLQGPPGTGKSQTITNLIGAALAAGKTVLFVSEKMAALEVVYRRLSEVGLAESCLELHSHKANKFAVIESLGKVFCNGGQSIPVRWEESVRDLVNMRDELNAYPAALHTERPLGMTFFEGSSRRLSMAKVPTLVWTNGISHDLDRQTFEAWLKAAGEFAARARPVEPVAANPWRDSSVEAWSNAFEDEVSAALAEAADHLKKTERSLAAFQRKGLLQEASPSEFDRQAGFAEVLAEGPVPVAAHDEGEWREVERRVADWLAMAAEDETERQHIGRRWTEEFLDLEPSDLLERYRSAADAFAPLRWLKLRLPSRRLQPMLRGAAPGARTITADLETLTKIQGRTATLKSLRSSLSMTFSGILDNAFEGEVLMQAVSRARRTRGAVARLSSLGSTLAPALRRLAEPAASPESRTVVADVARAARKDIADLALKLDRVASLIGLPLPGLSELHFFASCRSALESLQSIMPGIRQWGLYSQACTTAERAGLRCLVDAHRSGQLVAKELCDSVEAAVLDRWVKQVRDKEPCLRDFDGASHHDLVRRFAEADRASLLKARRHVAQLLSAKRQPTDSSPLALSSEPGILSREVRKKRRHMAIRKLFAQIPNLLVRLKPCMMMSPMSVAQYLPAGGKRFDLVVFDEASQIGTHDAIGALARGEQVVIVGDSKQLPPTSFFTRTADADAVPDDNDIEELESILDEALAVRMPSQTLTWHYRSRHESLIDFSNRHYYEKRLSIFPAARGHVEDLGIKWLPVPNGVYEMGRTQSNPREAKVLVDALVAELRQTKPGERSFGVVTFSRAQQTAVLDLLDEARTSAPEIEAHFSEQLQEPVFVKNLENVQGDERDEIYLSVCYGRAEDGKVRMAFGPLNRTGGERRLNVAVTRARRRMTVVSSMTHDDIDCARTSAIGANHLKQFLRFAAQRGRPDSTVEAISPGFDSEFERQVHDALVTRGIALDTQVGCAGYRIDLAVRHPTKPGEYALGIECDGAPYHSAASARDRDRLRQQVLEGLGWRLHRVWSTDWWFRREEEIERAAAAIQAAINSGGVQNPHINAPNPVALVALDKVPPGSSIDGFCRVQETASSYVPAPLPRTEGTSADQSEIDGGARPSVAPPDGPPTVPYPCTVLEPVRKDADNLFDAGKTAALRERILTVVGAEGPVHQERVIEALGRCYGIGRISERMRERISMQMAELRKSGALTQVGEYLWPRGVDRETYVSIRVPSGDSEARDLNMIPAEELAAAARWYLCRAFSLESADLARSVARLFGGRSLTRRALLAIQPGVDLLISQGQARVADERIIWVGPS